MTVYFFLIESNTSAFRKNSMRQYPLQGLLKLLDSRVILVPFTVEWYRDWISLRDRITKVPILKVTRRSKRDHHYLGSMGNRKTRYHTSFIPETHSSFSFCMGLTESVVCLSASPAILMRRRNASPSSGQTQSAAPCARIAAS